MHDAHQFLTVCVLARLLDWLNQQIRRLAHYNLCSIAACNDAVHWLTIWSAMHGWMSYHVIWYALNTDRLSFLTKFEKKTTYYLLELLNGANSLTSDGLKNILIGDGEERWRFRVGYCMTFRLYYMYSSCVSWQRGWNWASSATVANIRGFGSSSSSSSSRLITHHSTTDRLPSPHHTTTS